MDEEPKNDSIDWGDGVAERAVPADSKPTQATSPPATDVEGNRSDRGWQYAPPAPAPLSMTEINPSLPEPPAGNAESASRKPAAATEKQPERVRQKKAADHSEPFDRPDAQKLGIVGGKGVGKTYLFQAMVYRCMSGRHSGALTYYLERDGIRIFKALGEEGTRRSLAQTGRATKVNRATFIDKYLHWEPISTTRLVQQQWYRLRLLLRSGFLGQSQSAMDVEFFDASGEGVLGLEKLSPEAREVWEKAYLNARVMIFCLPLWAAFPSATLTDDEWNEREDLIKGFEQVVQNYNEIRGGHQLTPVSSILALTMSDDRRGALHTLYERWISPFLDSPETYLRQLRKGSGVATYVANARKVSEALHEEFASVRDPRVASIPQTLDFGRGRPWIIPLSAIDGGRLVDLNKRYPNPDDPARKGEMREVFPVPVHVELPLLVALCEHGNALM